MLLAVFAAPALAAERAQIDFIGYSADGRYFAFEEFGIQDGSGFAYSSIYVVDTKEDKWFPGTPFKVQAEDEEKTLAAIRAEVAGKAAATMAQLKLGSPVEIIALLGDGVPSADGKTMLFSVPSCCGPGQTQDDRLTLTLATYNAKDTLDCQSYTAAPALGFDLSLSDGRQTYGLHSDGDTIPASRGCAIDYRLYAVVQPFDSGRGGRIAIVSSYPFGFEGPDRRFLAVPIDR
jgi:predicted secreted protein